MRVSPLVGRGFEWANDVLAGKVPSGPLARLAVERFQKDLARDFPYYFDPQEADRWLQFLFRLKHVKGRWSGAYFEPSPYQCFCTMNLYGWRLREDAKDPETGELTPKGSRRFLEAYIEVPRKNGKSTWMAGLGLAHLTIDGESGAEVYCGATTEKQAWEVFRPARLMCVRDPDLCDELGIEINAKSLWRIEDGSRFEPIIGDPGDGPSPSCSITDEYHEHRNRNQVDSMETGMGARVQPMALKITTAGTDFGGPCYDEHREAERILNGAIEDDTKFVIIFAADPEVSWDSDEAMAQANPNLGISVSRRYLDQRRQKARNSPTKQATYKTKHLDHWVGAKAAWMNMLHLQRCLKKSLVLDERYDGRECFVGIDLASKIDIAAMALMFPEGDRVDVFFRYYLPEEAIRDERNERYVAWADMGLITETPGEIIDYGYIEEDLKSFCKRFDVGEVAYDPYQATQFSTRMSEEGITMVEVRPTVLSFSEPMKELEARIIDRRFSYNDEVFTWMVGNVVAKLDKKDNIYPDKERPEQKIDGVIAALMAMNRLLANQQGGVVTGRLVTI